METVVLHIITDLDSGGAERMLSRLVCASATQDAPRHVVVSLTDEGAYGETLRASGIELHCLNMGRGPGAIAGVPRLAELIRRRRPGVIMTWLYHADLIGTFAAILAGMGTRKTIWNLRCSNLDLSHYRLLTRWGVRLLVLLSSLPAAVAANSLAGIKHHETLGYRPKRWAYLPNGFDLDEWRPDSADRTAVREELGIDDRSVVIGMVARVNPQKDYATFLAAAECLAVTNDRLRFVIVGKGTEFLVIPPRLSGRMLALGERWDVQKLLRGFDIAILSSVYGEGFPNVVGEAMASGVPCVVSNVGDSADLVGDTGLVVPPCSPGDLTNAIARLLEETEQQRQARGRMARARIQRDYELSHVAAQYNALLVSIGQSP
jgi:glycosyltransferase involved in cell wall biosynthesis